MKFFSQRDPDWKNVKRYHALSVDSLAELDIAICESMKSPEKSRKKTKAWKAYGKFGAGISQLLENGLSKNSSKGYSIFDYGCWDCTIAMIVAQLGGKFYKYEEKRGLDANPGTFVQALKSWQILSLIGYSEDIYTDPVSIVTNGNIQLALHEDYGKNGINLNDATVYKYAINRLSELKDSIGIAICVDGHSAFGNKEDTHWVCIDPESPEGSIFVGDPDKEKGTGSTPIEGDTIYEVCVYATKSGVRGLLAIQD